MIARRVQVFGKVQGVFYRASTKTEADNLGVFGWVRNEPDGTVIIEAEGEEDVMKAFIAWCNIGPQFAKVSSVSVEDILVMGYKDFEVRY